MKNFTVDKAKSGASKYQIQLSDTVYEANLPAGDGSSIVVPNLATDAFIYYTPGAKVDVSLSEITESPTGTFDLVNWQACPAHIDVTSGQTLYFRAVNAAIVSVAFYGTSGGTTG